MKKLLVLGLCLLMMAGFAGCDSSGPSSDDGDKDSGKIKIEDIDWKAGQSIVDGERNVLLEYTNNSKYTISSFQITFKEKEKITDKEKAAYYKDITKECELSKDEVAEKKEAGIVMTATSEKVIEPKASDKNIEIYYYEGYYQVKKINHFDLTEPDILTVKYVADGKIHTEYYDFKAKEYSGEEETEEAYYWTQSELGKKIPKPDVEILTMEHDSDDIFDVKAFGVSKGTYDEYVKACKEKGFTKDLDSYNWDDSCSYSAKDKDGYDVDVDYDKEEHSMDVRIDSQGVSKKAD